MFEGLFSDDNPVLNFMRRVADITILNFLFVITCLPVFTIGAALTSLYYVSINAWGREDGYIFKMYFKSFKENFKQATLLWFVFFAVLGALGIQNFYLLKTWNTTGVKAYQVCLIIGAVIMIYVLFVFAYTWALLAKFENTVGGTLKNAALMSVLHLPETIGICMMPVTLGYLVYAVAIVRPFAFIFGFGFLAYMQALIFRHVLKPYLGEEEHHMTPEEELDYVGVLSVLKEPQESSGEKAADALAHEGKETERTGVLETEGQKTEAVGVPEDMQKAEKPGHALGMDGT